MITGDLNSYISFTYPTTSAQFYINVKDNTNMPTKDNTGVYNIINNGNIQIYNDTQRGNVLYFDGGATSYLTTSYNLPITHTRLFWIKLTNNLVSNNTVSTNSRLLMLDYNSTNDCMTFSLNYPNSLQRDTNTVSTGVWYFYGFTYDYVTATAKLYLNGTNVLTVNNISSYQTPDILYIGSYNATINNMYGYMDNIRCYNSVLTPTQIQNIYVKELNNPSLFYYDNNFNAFTSPFITFA